MALEDLKNSFKDSIGSVSDKLKDSLSVLKDLKDASTDKLTSISNDILGLGPLIEETGFIMSDVSVDITIPPGITISFQKGNEIDPAMIDKILEENNDKEMLKLIVRALQKADTMQKSMNLANYVFKGMSLKIGLPPDVSLKFEKK